MIGIDVLEIERMSKNAKDENFLKRVFTENERKYFSAFDNKLERITGYFCAKEAVMKALKDCKEISFLDIEINHKDCGAPFVELKNKAKQVFDLNYKKIDISISHSKTIATAICQID